MRPDQLRSRQAYLEALVSHWLRLIVRHQGTIGERKAWLQAEIGRLERQGEAGAAQVLRERVMRLLDIAEQHLNRRRSQ